MGSATGRGRFFLLACCQDVLMLRETVCPKMGQTGCKKTRHKFSRNPKLVKRNKWWAEKGVIPDVKSLLTGNKSRNKHVFWSMVRWGQWWQQSKTQKKDKHIGLVHGLSEKLYLTWHFKLICPIFCLTNALICLLIHLCNLFHTRPHLKSCQIFCCASLDVS